MIMDVILHNYLKVALLPFKWLILCRDCQERIKGGKKKEGWKKKQITKRKENTKELLHYLFCLSAFLIFPLRIINMAQNIQVVYRKCWNSLQQQRWWIGPRKGPLHRRSIGVKDTSRPPSYGSCYLPHHVVLASCLSFLISHRRAAQNMNDFSYFWFQYTHVQPLPTCLCITIVTSEAFSLPLPSLSMISKEPGPMVHSQGQGSSHRQPLTSILTPRAENTVDVAASMILQVLCSAVAGWSWSGPAFWKLFPRRQHSNFTSSLKCLAFQSKFFWPPCRRSILLSCSHPSWHSLHVFSLVSSPSEHEYFSHGKKSPYHLRGHLCSLSWKHTLGTLVSSLWLHHTNGPARYCH